MEDGGAKWMLIFRLKPDSDIQECLERLEKMLEAGVVIVDRFKCVGGAVIAGPLEACERLKQRVEAENFASMDRVGPPRKLTC